METPTKRKRGRPAASCTWRTLEDVAAITGADPALVARLLERVPAAIPGAVLDKDGWRVPERGLRALLGAPTGPLPVHATVAQVAECVQRDAKTVYGWLRATGADGRPLLPHRRILGMILIPAAAVLALPARMPGAPPSFFSARRMPAGNPGGNEA